MWAQRKRSCTELTLCVCVSVPVSRFAFVEGITSGMEDGTDSLPHLTNVKPDPDAPAAKPAAGTAHARLGKGLGLGIESSTHSQLATVCQRCSAVLTIAMRQEVQVTKRC